MEFNDLVNAGLKTPQWSTAMAASGPATKIPLALEELIYAKTPDEAKKAYWKLENHVVVQGQLFEAAIYTVPVLLAALVDYNRIDYVKIYILELLFQIVSGSTHELETARGLTNIDKECHILAKQGLWLLYREYISGESEAAKEIINVIDDDNFRRSFMKIL
jgi:hypothetical protein